ncbi:hypothetical protein MCBG_00714 [Micromonospora sp. M42]|uniref:hypothetical protein n=1 Tax=Micromonospora sp. M42 TaxID=457406 RepID=UPI0003EEDF1B|nr:hypothetical protein [Micromonospora sp. M42]EWM63581.1 hypothetical protein MCBG_00714 [Micromonospora sp. M42]
MRCASRPRLLLLLDGGIATVSLAVCLLALLASDAGPDTTGATAVAVGLAVAQAGCLLWIRRHPEYALGVAALAGVGLEALCPQLGWLAWSRCRWRTWPGCARPVLARRARAAARAHAVEAGPGGWRDLLLAGPRWA